jgi:hypothetical protein
MKSKYPWFPIGNILLNQVNIFIHTEFLITKLDIISDSVSGYTSTNLIIPPSFINIGKSFRNHPNIHFYSKHIAVSSMCFQTRNRLVDLESKYYKTNIEVI